MKAKIIKIGKERISRNGDFFYQRIKFMLDDGSFAMTDIVSNFRNYKYWQPVIAAGAGVWIDGIFLKDKGKVNADSQVKLSTPPETNQAGLF